MSKVAKIFSVSVILVLVLTFSIAATAFAAEPQGKCTKAQLQECECTQTQLQECECLCDGEQLQTRTQQVNNQNPEKGNRNQQRNGDCWVVD